MPKATKAKVGQNKKPVHPNSRRASAISRQFFRDMRVTKAKTARSKLDMLAEKCLWFKEHLNEEKSVYTKDELHSLVLEYLQRFDEELEQIEIISSVGERQGNQHASRLSAIKLTRDGETTDFETCGIEIPNLTTRLGFNALKDWNGEMKFLQNLKLKKMCQSDFDKTLIENCEDN